jgi:hypothetical protein
MTQAVRPFMVPNTQSDFLRLPSHAAPSRLPAACAASLSDGVVRGPVAG